MVGGVKIGGGGGAFFPPRLGYNCTRSVNERGRHMAHKSKLTRSALSIFPQIGQKRRGRRREGRQACCLVSL